MEEFPLQASQGVDISPFPGKSNASLDQPQRPLTAVRRHLRLGRLEVCPRRRGVVGQIQVLGVEHQVAPAIPRGCAFVKTTLPGVQ